MVTKNGIIGIAIAVAITIGVSSYLLVHQPQSSQNNPVTVNVVYNNFIDSVPFFVAEEKGYFADANINVHATAEQDASLVTTALLSGQADVGLPVATTDVLLIEEKEPGNLKLFLAGEETKNNPESTMILVGTNSSLASPNDLKGKKLGTLPGSVGNMLPQMILKNYFDPGQVTYVVLPPQDMISALTSGHVDAIWTVEPLTNIAVKTGVAKPILIAADASVQDPMPSIGYAFSTKFINEHPETAQQIVNIMKKAVNYMNANPDEARKILANYTGFPQDATGILRWEEYPDTSSVQQDYQLFADKMFAMGFLDHKIDVKDIIYGP